MILSTAALCLALNVYHEARDQPLIGQKAVAYVTLRRADFKSDRICSVVFAPRQFSWTNSLTESRGQERARLAEKFMPSETQAWATAKQVALRALDGRAIDFTGGADHYYNPAKAQPYWRKAMRPTAKIGDHVFLAKR